VNHPGGNLFGVQSSVSDLTVTWWTLRAAADNYESGSPGEATLIEACRLIEIEVRAQHGDAAQEALRADPH